MDHMSDKQNKKIQETDSNNDNAPNQKRRALSKAALAAPVLGALASRPALGQGRVCSVSVLMSGDASVPIDYNSCVVCSPGFWFSAPSKECFWPIDINKTTVFGSAFTSSITSASNDPEIKAILDKLLVYPVGNFSADNKNDFKNQFDFGNGRRKTASSLFMFCRAASAALLNVKTIGAMSPMLILNHSLHSVTEIEAMVNKVFNGSSDLTKRQLRTLADGYASDLSADWGGSETTVCSMFGTCPP